MPRSATRNLDALRDALRYAEDIIATVREPLLVLDAELRVVSANRSFYRVFQTTPEETEQKSVFELAGGRWNIPKLKRPLAEILPRRTQFEDVEVHVTLPQGERVMLLNARQFTPPFSGEAAMKLILLAFEDITGRERAEAKLKGSEERFRSLMEQSPLSIQLFDATGQALTANPAWEQLWDDSREELEDFNILKDEQLEAAGLMPYINKAFAGEAVRLPETHYDPAKIGKNARPRWIAGYMYPLTVEDGKPSEVALVHYDITDRKQTEEALREKSTELERQSRTFDVTLSSITDFAYTFDREGRFVYVNKPLLDLWGMELEEAVGKTFMQLPYQKDLAERLHRQIQQVFESGERLTDETFYTNPQGHTGYYEYIFSPVLREDGGVELVAGLTRDITVRKQAEREREELLAEARVERQRLADVFDNATSFMCLLRGPEHVFEQVNKLYLQLVGNRDILGKPARQALPDIEGQGFFELLDKVYETGETYLGTDMFIRLRPSEASETEEHWLDFVYQAMRDKDGVITGIFVQGVDLTQRHQAEEALRESEQRYRTLFNSLDEGFCVIEKVEGEPSDFRYVEANPAFKTQTGVGDVVGKTLREVFPGESEQEAWQATYDAVLRTGEPVRFERELTSQGRMLELYAFRLEGKARSQVAVIFKDISERKRAERETTRLASIVDSSDDAIISKNLDGVIRSWNKASEKMFGYTAEEAIGQTIATLITPEDRQEEEEGILRRLSRGETIDHFETVRKRKDGSAIEVSVTISPLYENGKIIGASKIARDITVRRWAEEALREHSEELDRRVRKRTTQLESARRRFQTIFESNPTATAITTLEGEITEANKALERIFGDAKNSLTGRNLTELLELEPERYAALADTIKRRGYAPEVGLTVHTREGEVREVLASWELLKLAEGDHLLLMLEDVSERRALERELHSAAARLFEKREQVNLSLAQDLHDTVVQQLIGTGYGLEADRKALLPRVSGETSEMLEKALALAQGRVLGAVSDLRRLISELRPPGLLEFGLVQTLQRYVKHLNREAEGPPITFHLDDEDAEVPDHAGLALFRLAQEALRNVQKHAQAKRVEVNLHCAGGVARLSVRDDGVGFVVPERLSLLAVADHFGLVGLEEQVNALGGALTLHSAPGKGCEIAASVPLAPEGEA